MKKIIKNASIGVEETNDMLVEVEPAGPGSGVTIDFKTSVPYQYGDHLYHLILKTILTMMISISLTLDFLLV